MTENFNQIFSDLEDLGTADQFIDEILEIIHHISLFSDFNEDEIMTLCHYMRCFAAPRDYALLEEGGSTECLLIVLTGTAETRYLGDSSEVAELSTGSVIGEISLLDGKTQLAGCITTSPVDFAVLTRGGLNRILMHAPRLGNKLLLALLERLTSRLRQTDKRFLPSLA
jgi:CRP/FNR family transcriptional regulator, cyclic AMP receptor protein